MHLRISVIVALALGGRVLAADLTGWQGVLDSVNLSGDPRIHVLGPEEAADPAWDAKVRSGAVLILEGESGVARAFGFRPTTERVIVTSLRDVHGPGSRIVLEKAIEMSRWNVPSEARVFTTERWTGAALVAGIRLGKGAVLWSAVGPGQNGYERFPYLIQALADLGVELPFRSNRLWAFFDYSYRRRVDLAWFAQRWRKAGIGALQVAAWHFYDRDEEGDRYLRELIDACHREGVLVYAWLELPHVSERFWRDHPEWREKTGVLQDAQLDWRKLMNLSNPDCARAARSGIKDLIIRFDWDGVNLAELYFESLEGASNPARFTPMNADVRGAFRKEPGGFDPIEIWSTRKDAASLRRFLDFRAELVRKMQEEWLGEAETYRAVKPDLDVVLTHVDDRLDRGTRDAIGADAGRVLPLLREHEFTFLIEDPATVWNLGPQRYGQLAERYVPLTRRQERLAVDINIVDRYQDVYPTKQQAGVELFELVHMAAAAFSRVALYFENSIGVADWELLPGAAAVPGFVERVDAGMVLECPAGFGVRRAGPVMVDGRVWAVGENDVAWLPVGRHEVRVTDRVPEVRMLAFNGTLLSADVEGRKMAFEYTSDARAIALVGDARVAVDVEGGSAEIVGGDPGAAVLLPRGRHRVEIRFPKAPQVVDTIEPAAVVR